MSNFKTKQQRLDASRTQPHGSVLVKVVACVFCCSWQVFSALCVWRFCVTDWLCWGSESCENLAWHWGISVLHIVRYSAVLRRICVWYQYYCTEYWNGFYTCPSLSRLSVVWFGFWMSQCSGPFFSTRTRYWFYNGEWSRWRQSITSCACH